MKMMMFFMMLVVFVGSIFVSNNYVKADSQDISIIPRPVSMQVNSGVFVVDPDTVVLSDNQTLGIAKQLCDDISKAMGFSLAITTKASAGQKAIVLKINPELNKLGREGYTLSVQPGRVQIESCGKAGVFYGIQTLRQLLPVEVFSKTKVDGVSWKMPCVEIKDYPRFKWRGMHLDVSRHFFDAEFVKKYIDWLSIHKMNVFHWHLVDGQGWRLEIKRYPRLTEIGAWRTGFDGVHWNYRKMKFPGKDSGQKLYGGYYTQQQVRDIVKYAYQRFVTVVPEIEMPGHSWAALIAYPQYTCTETKVAPDGMHNQNVYCAGKDATFKFLENILDETMALFDSPYIHIGGDEVNKNFWKHCKDCNRRMKELGLKDYNQLQSYFIKRIEKYVNSKGRKIIGWDEILQGGLAPNAAVMSWRGMGGGIAAAKAGHDVVMAPVYPLYFDARQSNEPRDMKPRAIGYAPNTLKKVYNFEPIPKGLTKQQASHIMGAQGQAWTEWMFDAKRVEYMVLPRECALSEVDWTPAAEKNYTDFYHRLQKHVKRLALLGINYRTLDPLPVIIGQWKSGETSTNYQPKRWDITGKLQKAGSYIITFAYTGGAHRLDIKWIKIMSGNKVIASDEHHGITGASNKDNTYTVNIKDVQPGQKYYLLADIRSDGGTDSNGEIHLTKKK